MQFTLEDFHKQIKQVTRLGRVRHFMRRLIPWRIEETYSEPDTELRRISGIINSMTPEERAEPEQIQSSHRSRIARGSGVPPLEVKKLVRDFQAMQRLLRKIDGMSARERRRAVLQMEDAGMFDPQSE